MNRIRSFILFFCILGLTTCYHAHPITPLPKTELVQPRTLFIALDGIDYKMMHELKKEGHFRDFLDPLPMISTFPSATTIGFTGIFQSLNVGKVAGYEVRFYSFKDDNIIGGTPKDIYKIPIKYKYFFDYFRHKMTQKALMYSFPGVAGKEDLLGIEDVLFSSKKNIMMTYIGGTDGSAHMLGRNRTKRYLIYVDEFLQRIKRRYQKEVGTPLRIVMFSDHGFTYDRLKTVSNSEMSQRLEKHGFHINSHLQTDKDVVAVRFGLISAGALFAKVAHRAEISRLLSDIPGMDLTFWHLNDPKTVYVRNAKGQEAKFEYQGKNLYSYVSVNGGDPLNYLPTLRKHGYASGAWLPEKVWLNLFYDHDYPDVGYRIYDAFFNLVSNQASILFSVKANYQYGSFAARLGTYVKFGQRGTHGAMLRQPSWAFAMTDYGQKQKMPKFLRYDTFFEYFIPHVTESFRERK